MDEFAYRRGLLHAEDVSLEALAGEYGTPTYVYSRAALERNYTAYPAPRPERNELFSQFNYTKLKGLDYNNHDGTITRRDPSKVIFANGKYYVWYTHRQTPTPPRGAALGTEALPSQGWGEEAVTPTSLSRRVWPLQEREKR